MIKKTFIYDTSRGLSALIKHQYSEKLDIQNCCNIKKFKVFTMSDFDICFFVVNDIEDLLLLRDIYSEIKHFFIATPKKYFNQKIKSLNFKDSIIIDLDYSKRDIVKEIDFNLSRIILNHSLIKVERNKVQVGYSFK